jgi:hypothetical protein
MAKARSRPCAQLGVVNLCQFPASTPGESRNRKLGIHLYDNRVYQSLRITSGLPVTRAELFIFFVVLHLAVSEIRLKNPPLPQ